ncbi:Dot/Icm T4SS effector AnkC/LegA12 [Legionella quateirensis]|uniref:Ankyrin repeat-containing protein n=1 Tax=Legionella quateirensis TaxID=45072 RepID=A0A378KXR9_9GAMM|nr:Dot/Icm T4SS effector AnkC/LegA12 [Legionella quateirensis]KTD55455.1 ankyrin repeat-containing protein [Legionella quateirensis]STY16630.1 ankyrin repeat-containing protein [Legionella quateirensis]
MDFIDEMNKAAGLKLDDFRAFVNRKLQHDKDYLDRLFWLPNGSQMTVLNYLIEQHQETVKDSELDEPSTNLMDKMDVVLELSSNVNVGEPLHQAIASGKIQLALHLLQADKINYSLVDYITVNVISALNALREKTKEFASQFKSYFFDINKRDSEGRTLLSLAIDTKNPELLMNILIKEPNIHSVTNRSNAHVKFQPLHQAVVLDYADGVRLLAQEGANLANPMGVMKDTPVLLASRLGKINALEALMEFPVEKLNLNAENNHYFGDKKTGHTAIEELCLRIANNEGRADAIRGVAVLLCHGAEPPRNETMRTLLRNNRVTLLKAVHSYLENKPDLVDPFVNRCHLTESALHYIIYADHSWGSSIRHLLGSPCSAAFLVEDLVIRKYSNTLVAQGSHEPLQTAANANLSLEHDPLKLYAEFVRRYKQAYENQLVPNCWSTMRWMIAEGRSDWGTVERYAKTYPKSRTGIIYNEMFPKFEAHEDIDSFTQEQSSPKLT